MGFGPQQMKQINNYLYRWNGLFGSKHLLNGWNQQKYGEILSTMISKTDQRRQFQHRIPVNQIVEKINKALNWVLKFVALNSNNKINI